MLYPLSYEGGTRSEDYHRPRGIVQATTALITFPFTSVRR